MDKSHHALFMMKWLIERRMLHLVDPGLDAATAKGLQRYQAKVDAAGNYRSKVEEGKKLFSRYNRKTNPVFKTVRACLASMCSGARRCGYCEDSAADEVEHFKPKALYPEVVFVWKNYVLSCGPCNGAKISQFAIIQGNGLVDVTRGQNAPILKPQNGAPAPINPRIEDPLNFLDLEITDTFQFLPREGLSQLDEGRAEYSIKLLKLNRDVLLEARRDAYRSYRARLREYRDIRDNGASNRELRTLRHAIITSSHPTVWCEMLRQQSTIPELRNLFLDVPEALNW